MGEPAGPDWGQVQAMLDRAAILECLHRYARGIDRHDRELAASAYFPDALDDHGLFVGGPEGLVEWANTTLHQRVPRHQHHLTTHNVDLQGDAADVETYWFLVARNDSGPFSMASGRYFDRFERRSGEWRIAARVVLLETATGAADTAVLDRAFPRPEQDRSDPSYRRPFKVSRSAANEPHISGEPQRAD